MSEVVAFFVGVAMGVTSTFIYLGTRDVILYLRSMAR